MKLKHLIILVPLFVGCDKKNNPMNLIAPMQSAGPIVILVAGQSNGLSAAVGVPDGYSLTGHVSVYQYMAVPGTYGDNETIMPTVAKPDRRNWAWIRLGDR